MLLCLSSKSLLYSEKKGVCRCLLKANDQKRLGKGFKTQELRNEGKG